MVLFRNDTTPNHHLIFTIDALSASGDQAWRLLDDEGWRNCTFAENIVAHDAQLSDMDTIKHWSGCRLKKDKKHTLARMGKPGMFDFFIRGIFTHAIPHRVRPAPQPEKIQMLNTIQQAHAGTPWLLYLNLAAQFRMLDTTTTAIIDNLDIAVRGEIASSADYVGSHATENTAHMDEIWHQFLAGWLEHLMTRRLGIFIPKPTGLQHESDLLVKINACPHESITSL